MTPDYITGDGDNYRWTQQHSDNGHNSRLFADMADFLISSSSNNLIEGLLMPLRKEWEITEQSPVSKHMVLEIFRDTNGIRISARKHVNVFLTYLNGINAILCDYHTNLAWTYRHKNKTNQIYLLNKKILYQKGIGHAQFLAHTVADQLDQYKHKQIIQNDL